MAVNNMLQSAAGGLQIAGSFTGIPYASAAGTLLSGIIDAAQQIIVHKRKCTLLTEKCRSLKIALEENEARLVGTELQAPADEMQAILDRVHSRTRRYKNYNKVKSFCKSISQIEALAWSYRDAVKMGEIEKGIEQCNSDLENAISIFNLTANIHIHDVQRETLDHFRGTSAHTEELLMQILTSHEAMREVMMMESQGEHVAGRLMEAGQLRMQQLNSRTLLSPRTSSERYGRVSPSPGSGRASPQPNRPSTSTTSTPRASPLPRDMFVDRKATSSPPPMQERDQIRRALYELHKLTGVPPSVKILDGEVEKVGELAVTGGTYSDIWEGTWMGQEKVALKALRNIKASDQKAKRRFEAEIQVWDKLDHPHILAFYGIVTNLGQIHMVSPWQDYGNVLELSSTQHEARICDFGMSTVIEQVTETAASATLTAAGSARWLAPELIEGTVSSPTIRADIYSFAMAILELLTGKHPFSDVKRDASVIHRIIVLKRPPVRPVTPAVQPWLTDDLWDLMLSCWSSDANKRPLMKYVAARIKNIEDSMGMSNLMDTA
ncbi:hypothetical protein HWV62_24109 [Athelia sp. TMB]|nr:hypothetical protein HWV62_24109 [Athelia sp. TMB]